MERMEKSDYAYRLVVVIMGLLQPIIILLVLGEIGSISSSWNTPLQPLFIIVNAMTSYFFFDAHRWRLSSLLLLLLTAFSVVSFPITHNIIATLFFISCIRPIYMLKKFRVYLIFYLIGVPIGICFGLFWGEFWGAWVLCIYHIHVVTYMYKLGVRKRYHIHNH